MSGMYPVMINLQGRNCLVVGGGAVGTRKTMSLLECGAMVDLVSPIATSELENMAVIGSINWKKRRFLPSDIADHILVFACTDDADTNNMIFRVCEANNILINAVDDPPNCNFIVPSTLRRGALVITVSTEGSSPLLARQIREDLEQQFSAHYGDYLDLLKESRSLVKSLVSGEDSRRALFKRILELDVLSLLEQGNKEEAKGRIMRCIYSWPD